MASSLPSVQEGYVAQFVAPSGAGGNGRDSTHVIAENKRTSVCGRPGRRPPSPRRTQNLPTTPAAAPLRNCRPEGGRAIVGLIYDPHKACSRAGISAMARISRVTETSKTREILSQKEAKRISSGIFYCSAHERLQGS